MTHTKSFQVDVEDGHLYYDKTGEGPAVVLLHGFGVDRRSWYPQVEAFAERYTVVAVDLRGFGLASMPEGPYRHYDDVARVLDYLEITQASIVGSSMGGRVALDFAIAYPERTRVVVSADGVPSGFVFDRPLGAPRGPSREQVAQTLKSLGPERAETFLAIVADYTRWHRKNDDPRVEISPPAIMRLDEVMAPTLVIVGGDDLPDYHKAADMLTTGIAGARRYVIGGAGHLPNLDSPEEFNQVVLEFLDLNRSNAGSP
jgi:3-oxoadipate enol-lactonase